MHLLECGLEEAIAYDEPLDLECELDLEEYQSLQLADKLSDQVEDYSGKTWEAQQAMIKILRNP